MPANENRNEQKAKLKGMIVPILLRYNVLSASLFGSAGRGEAGPESDVDILVRYRRGTTLFDIAGLKLELEQALGRRVDLTSPETLKPWLREQVLSEQVPLV